MYAIKYSHITHTYLIGTTYTYMYYMRSTTELLPEVFHDDLATVMRTLYYIIRQRTNIQLLRVRTAHALGTVTVINMRMIFFSQFTPCVLCTDSCIGARQNREK